MDVVNWAAFDQQVDVLDACWMVNEEGKVVVKPRGHQVAGKAAALGAVGLLIGALFALPVAGMAAGAAIGGYRGKHGDQKFESEFVESIKTKVAEGGSAVVILYEDGADTERAGAELAELGGTVFSSTIAADQLAKIQEELDSYNTDS